MNILFLTLVDIKSISESGIYSDLLREFWRNGHAIYVVSPAERRSHEDTRLIKEDRTNFLRVKTGNIQKANLIEKGISTVLLEKQLIKGIKTYFADVAFDLVLYSTPPITFAKVVEYVKKRDGAKTYLLLKDIFPQNAVDIGMMSKTGIKGLLYRYFRNKEKKLYAISDRIGCMSQANVDYVLKHNPEVSSEKVEICPNAIEVQDMTITAEERFALREKYGIPQDKKVFVYGGNLGKPQGIPFIIECLKSQENNADAYFLIVGDGTEYGRLEAYFRQVNPANMQLVNRMPKDDYDRMIAACDVGLIFLDHRFTIPNFPSRLLAYMQAGLPVLACTDPNTDLGKVIVDGGFGWWCESNDAAVFSGIVSNTTENETTLMGERAQAYLKENYSVEKNYSTIIAEQNKG